MKVFLLALITIILISYGLYKIITGFITVPSREIDKNIQNMQGTEGVLDDLKKLFISTPAKFIARFVNIDMYKRQKLSRDLERAGYKENPEEFYGCAIVKAAYCVFIGVCLILLNSTLIGVLTIAVSIIVYLESIDKLNDKLKERNEQIMKELPTFIRTYNNALRQSKDFLKFAINYRQIAKPNFYYDLDVLITDLKTMDEESALTRFANRINISHLSQFANAVIASNKGSDQSVYFQQLNHDMNVLAIENVKREIDKRPEKVKPMTMIVVFSIFATLLYPIIMQLVGSMGVFLN